MARDLEPSPIRHGIFYQPTEVHKLRIDACLPARRAKNGKLDLISS